MSNLCHKNYSGFFPFDILQFSTTPSADLFGDSESTDYYTPFQVSIPTLVNWYWNIQTFKITVDLSLNANLSFIETTTSGSGTSTSTETNAITSSYSGNFIFSAVQPAGSYTADLTNIAQRVNYFPLTPNLISGDSAPTATTNITVTTGSSESSDSTNSSQIYDPYPDSNFNIFGNYNFSPAYSKGVITDNTLNNFYPVINSGVIDYAFPSSNGIFGWLTSNGLPPTNDTLSSGSGPLPSVPIPIYGATIYYPSYGLATVGTFTFDTYSCPIYNYVGSYIPTSADGVAGASNGVNTPDPHISYDYRGSNIDFSYNITIEPLY